MKEQTKEDCCGGCQSGQPGKNPKCQAKLLAEKLQIAQKQGKREME